MFTGIVEEVGQVVQARGLRLEIASGLSGLGLGDSIAVNGVCLTVVDVTPAGFAAELSEEFKQR